MDKTREYRPAQWYRGKPLPDGPVRVKVAKVELPALDALALLLSQPFSTPSTRKRQQINEASRRWRAKNKEKIAAYAKVRQSPTEEQRAARKAYIKEYDRLRLLDPIRHAEERARRKKTREQKKDHVNALSRAWWARNKERIAVRRRLKRKGSL